MTILVKAAKALLRLDTRISQVLAAARARQAAELRERADGATIVAHEANAAKLQKAVAKHKELHASIERRRNLGHDKADHADDKAITHAAQCQLNQRARDIL